MNEWAYSTGDGYWSEERYESADDAFDAWCEQADSVDVGDDVTVARIVDVVTFTVAADEGGEP